MDSGLKQAGFIVGAGNVLTGSVRALLLVAAVAGVVACWSGCGDNSVSNGTSNQTVYTLQISTNPIGGGTVTRNPDKSTYSAGEQVTVRAQPASGYSFVAWSGVSTSTSASVTVTMNANLVLTANFHSNTLVDARDGQIYKTVKIGNQIWMAQNLNYQIVNSWCYDNLPTNCTRYGRLYDWNTAMISCPVGWHLPSNQEWNVLINATGDENTAGKKLKAKSDWDWNSRDNVSGTGTDVYGFSALPTGFRATEGDFRSIGLSSPWWTATESVSNGYAIIKVVDYLNEHMSMGGNDKGRGCPVRCLQN